MNNFYPREYWRILNANQPKAKDQANLEGLYTCKYFKDINQFEYERNNNKNNVENNNNNNCNASPLKNLADAPSKRR